MNTPVPASRRSTSSPRQVVDDDLSGVRCHPDGWVELFRGGTAVADFAFR
jgi:hypothetical protein